MKRVIFLAMVVMVVILAMLILMPMGVAQEMTEATVTAPPEVPDSGGPAILLPAAALLLGSGILTYAMLRRREVPTRVLRAGPSVGRPFWSRGRACTFLALRFAVAGELAAMRGHD
jgi:hypothetical protein